MDVYAGKKASRIKICGKNITLKSSDSQIQYAIDVKILELSQHFCQVNHARQCGWMLFTQRRLAQPDYFSMHLFCLAILTLIIQHSGLVVHAR